MNTDEFQKKLDAVLKTHTGKIQHIGKKTDTLSSEGITLVDVLIYRDMQKGEKFAYLLTVVLKGENIKSVDKSDAGYPVGTQSVKQVLDYFDKLPSSETTRRTYKLNVRESMKTKLVRVPSNVPLSVIKEAIKLHESMAEEISNSDRSTILYSLQKIEGDLSLNSAIRKHIEKIFLEVLGKTAGSGVHSAAENFSRQFEDHVMGSVNTFKPDWSKI